MTPPDTPESRVEGIEERLAKATPGPWEWRLDVNGYIAMSLGEPDACTAECPQGEEDAVFIANAPADIRYLLDTVKELTQALEEQEASLSRMLDEDGWPIPRLAARLHRLRTLARQALTAQHPGGEL